MKHKYFEKPTKKERMILELIYKYDFIATSNMVYLYKHPSNRHEILKKIKNKGFIERHIISPKSNIWYLSEMGIDFLSEDFPDIDYKFSIDDFEGSMLKHNSGLVNIELFYNEYKQSRSALKRFFCEKEVASIFNGNRRLIKQDSASFFRIPDLMFKYESSQFKKELNFVIELELSLKSKKRYHDIFYFYKFSEYVGRVYWICADEKFKLKLIDIFKTLYQKNLDRIVLTEGRNEYYMERVLKLHYFIEQKTFLKCGFNKSKRLIEFLE
jgi:hypothetical protein